MNEYQKIDKAIKEWETYRPVTQYSTDWICNRIEWAWKWRKITKEQMEELADRICVVLDERGV